MLVLSTAATRKELFKMSLSYNNEEFLLALSYQIIYNRDWFQNQESKMKENCAFVRKDRRLQDEAKFGLKPYS